ncbi:endonuclease/exonuclease/phosphatase family protein [Candidatus Dependentiae bacterium]|nr:endonuclease/exonuclease/phosphatase family protein [Candidatus Dependentiae bacterium]
MSYSVLSWNILGPATRDVEDYGFIRDDYGRLGKHLEIIQQYQADILCFQEVDLTTLHFFNNFLLAQYTQLAYHEKGAHGGVVVYIKKSKFTIVNTISSVLKTNEKFAPGAFCGGIIKNVADGSDLFIASVHLSKSSHPQVVSRALTQISDLCIRLKSNLPSQIIFAGDFNTMYEDMKEIVVPAMSQILSNILLMFEHESCTANSVKGELKSIDHVIYSNLQINLTQSCVVSKKYKHIDTVDRVQNIEKNNQNLIYKELPSDHAPILVVFE